MPEQARRLVIAVTSTVSVNKLVAPVLPAIAAAGWDVHVIADPDVPLEHELTAATLHNVPMARTPGPTDARSLLAMRNQLQELSPHVVMGSTPKASLLSLVAAKSLRIPHRVYWCRGARWEGTAGLARRAFLTWERATAAMSTAVLAVSPSLADRMVADRVVRTRPTVLGDGGSKGVDTDRFRPTAGDAPLTLGFVGRIARDKGIAEVLAVFDLLGPQHPGLGLVVAGWEDATDPVPAEVLARLHDDPAIEMLGHLTPDQMPAAFQKMGVLIFPSAREGLPNAVIEAAACGVPTIGWEVTGVRDAVDPGVSGALVAPGELGQMAEAAGQWLGSLDGCRPQVRGWGMRFDQDRITRLLVDYLDRL